MHVQGGIRQLARFQKAAMSSLVMDVPYTKVSIKEQLVLFQEGTALFGGNRTQSSTSCNMGSSGFTTFMVLLSSTCTCT